MHDSVMLFKALSDKSRLRILSNLTQGPMYVELLSERLNLSPSTVSFHLKKLELCGLVYPSKQQYYVVYTLNKSLLDQTLISLINTDERDAKSQNLREKAYKEEVLKMYFNPFCNGKLSTIPVQKERKQIILKEIASKFDSSITYTKSDVDSRLAFIFDDFENLKLELIANKFLKYDKELFHFHNNDDI